MNSLEFENELKALLAERQSIVADMTRANEALVQTQRALDEDSKRRSSLDARIAPLEQVNREIGKSRSAIERHRQEAKHEVEVVGVSLGDQLAEISRKLPSARRNAISAALELVETAIDEQKRKLQELQDKSAETEASIAEAQKRAAGLDLAFREASTQLRILPGQIQAARGQVSKLNDAAKAATASGRTGEALYLTGELKQALDELSHLIDAEKETELVNRLEEAWHGSKTAKVDIAKRITALAELRRDRAATESSLQSKIQRRDADIRAALILGQTAEMPPARPSAEPVSTTRRKSVARTKAER